MMTANKCGQFTHSNADKNPLSLLLPRSGNKIQLPFNKERSSVIYRGKGGKAACVWCKASNTECCAAKPHNILPKIHRGAENALHYLCAPAPSKCDRTAVTPSFFMRPKGALHTPKACFMCRRHASFAASAALFSSLSPHFIKKISFQCKFFASVCKKLLQKGQKSFII